MFFKRPALEKGALFIILVATLGYFIDIFDLLLFSVVRVPSLRSIGVAPDAIMSTGLFLINMQIAGLVIGGFVWGILGDKYGRLSVLLGSILMYSTANLANAFVDSVPLYALLRFLSGIGLAGELGVGVTLVSEILPTTHRGVGTTFIGAVGLFGAVAGGLIGDSFDWRIAYGIGGSLGFLLLCLRVRLTESKLYLTTAKEDPDVKRGDIWTLFTTPALLRRYIAVTLVPVPLLMTVWILVALTPEFSGSFGASPPLQTGKAIMACYMGLTLGNAAGGVLSQYLRSRRKAVVIFTCILICACAVHLMVRPTNALPYYVSCLLMGFGCGYWILAVQLCAEQFGTNLRATVTTSIPNVARGAIIPLTFAFKALSPMMGIENAWSLLMGVTVLLSMIGLWSLKESFHQDLNYIE